MEIEASIKKLKDIYSALIDFIDADDDSEFERVINIFDKLEILENKEEIGLIIQLISKLSDNHHRTSNFFDKIEKIFRYLMKNTLSPILNFIRDYTKYNKRIVFLLLDKKIIQPDEAFINSYLQSNQDIKNSYYYYLYPKMKEYLEEQKQKQIEEEILKIYEEKISTFEEKCQIGENDSYICSLIRSDSVEEFIIYVNQTNLSLLTKIKPSIYETNLFLTDETPTLIEYAAFYGSIQIIQFLKYNNVPLTSSLWLFAVHSNNAELIHFLEENKIEQENYKYGSNSTLKVSIICHHNEISNYIKNNLYDQIQTDYQNKFYDDFSNIISDSLNFYFFPSEIESINCQPLTKKGFKLSQLCFSLTIITIPSSVTSIGDFAFYECSKLTKVIIPSSVKSIGNFAFFKCSSLQQISLENPSSITSIGLFVFLECSSLEQIPIQFSDRDNGTIITILLGSTGSGKTSLSWVLSGKDVKVKITKYRRTTLERLDNYDYDIKYSIYEIVNDESNKIAYIELHEPEYREDIDVITTQLNYIQYLFKAIKNEVKVKILILINEYEIGCSYSHPVIDLFRRFDALFPNLNNSEKKAVGIVITKGDEENEPIDYINELHEIAYDTNTRKWIDYYHDHQEQFFIMPKASKHMEGKSFDFEDKHKIIDFIKRD